LIYSAPLAYPMYALSVSGADVSVILDLTRLNSLQIIDRAAKTKVSDTALPKNVGRMEMNDETQELMLYTQTGYILYSLETQEILANVSFREMYAGSIWISSDKSRLVQIGNGAIRLVDLATETLLGEQDGYDDRAWQVAVSGNRLAAAKGAVWERDTRLILWDLDTLESVAVVGAPEFSATISDVFFLPNETELITYASGEEMLKVWNASDVSKNRDIDLTGQVLSAGLSADGAVLAVGYGGVVGVLQLPGASAETSFYMDSFVSRLSLSANGNRIAACDGWLLVVWDAASQSDAFAIADDDVVAPALTPDGERVAALYRGEDGYLVKMIDVGTGKTVWKHTLTDNYQHMCFAPDGSMLAVSAYDDGLIFLNAETGKTVYTLAYSVSDFAFSKDGRFVITASSDGSVRLWGIPAVE
ncbi:MAG: WD40 repeat domain-containing protein, partial [Bacillota bacterium]